MKNNYRNTRINPRSKIFRVFLCFFFFAFCFSCSRYKGAAKQKNIVIEKDSFFVSVPITKFSPIHTPCIDIELDSTVYSVGLDLGFKGYLLLGQSAVEQISCKTKEGSQMFYGIRGKQYPHAVYEIPKVKIGDLIFSRIPLLSEAKDFGIDAIFRKEGEKAFSKDPAKLGWCLFYNTNLLIDIAQKKVVFCNSFKTLQEHGYFFENWIEVPMFLERGLVEFEALTPQGALRCVLDTGATLNVLHLEDEKIEDLDKAFWDPKHEVAYPWFKVQGYDLGETSFHSVPIRLPIPIEAILGMEFFSKHVVFLDFGKKRIVFSPS